jgi:hypothetical protein
VARVERDLRDATRASAATSPTRSADMRTTAPERSEVAVAPADQPDLDPDRPFLDAPSTAQLDGDSGPTMDPAPASPTPTAAEPPSTGPAFSITDVERVWPAVVASIRSDVGPRRHALLREAVPVAVDGSTITFEVPSHMHFHLEQLKADTGLAAAIATSAADQLGAPVTVAYRSAEAAVADVEPERAPDKDHLTEESDEGGSDPADTVIELLGGEIVHETGRD